MVMSKKKPFGKDAPEPHPTSEQLKTTQKKKGKKKEKEVDQRPTGKKGGVVVYG